MQVEMGKVLTFFQRHKDRLYLIGSVVLLLIVIAAGWTLYRMNYNKSAFELYNQVGKMAAATKPGAESQKLIEGYKNVTLKYPRSQAAWYASYELGKEYFNLNQFDLSLKAYGEFLRQSAQNNFLRVFAYTGQGYCYEAKKDFKKALLSFETALKVPEGKDFAGQIYRDIARVYEETNDPKKALEYYRKALDKTTDRTWQEMLKRKIASLG